MSENYGQGRPQTSLGTIPVRSLPDVTTLPTAGVRTHSGFIEKPGIRAIGRLHYR